MRPGQVITVPYPRCTPGQPWPSALRCRFRNFPIAKTDQSYGEICAYIRNITLKSFSHLDLPWASNRARNAINRLARRGELRLVGIRRYRGPKGRLNPVRIYTKNVSLHVYLKSL